MEIVISVIALVLAVSCLFLVTKSDLRDYLRVKKLTGKSATNGEQQ